MSIYEKLDNNILLITPNSIKENILKNISKMLDIKYMSLEELKENLLYRYHNHTIYYLIKKSNMLPENAKLILNDIYYVDEYMNNSKLDYLYDIKKDLIDNDYIIYNNLFREYLKSKRVIIYGYSCTKELAKLIKIMENYTEVEFVEDDINTKLMNVYEYSNIEEEVAGIAEQITLLINKGVDINKIYLHTPTNEYISTINRLFSLFNLSFQETRGSKLTLFPMTKYFLELFDDTKISDSDKVLKILIINYPLDNAFNIEIYNTIINVLNNYYDINETLIDLKDIIYYELENSYIKSQDYLNIIKEVNIFETKFNSDEYVFIMGINQDILPIIEKDDDYLSNGEKEILNIDNSIDLTSINKKDFINAIMQINNCYLSYKLEGYSQTFLPSTIFEDKDLFNITSYQYQYTNNNYNNYLLASKYDLYYKYNTVDPIIKHLNNKTTSFNYHKYNNQYQGISFDLLNRYLDNKITLSYSSIDTFYKCQFAFYLKNILKINKPIKNDRSLNVGNAFHKILCEVYRHNFEDVESTIDTILPSYFAKNSNKDSFFINKYKQQLLNIIDILKQRETDFTTTYLEKSFYINKDSNLSVTIMGIIDKVLTLTIDNNTYVIVIDYKTGQANIDLNRVIYGLDMQLLMYLYLLKHNNYKFAGAYINPIMPGLINAVPDKSYQELFIDTIRLDGYTINDERVVSSIDHHYLDSSFIKGIRVKKDGGFYSTSKVYDTSVIDQLLNIVEDNINNCFKSVENSDFKINPKRIGMEKTNDITGCRYCEYYDICYHKTNDIINLKEYKNLEFLGCDNHDMD